MMTLDAQSIMDRKYSYTTAERSLQILNKHYVSLQDDDVKQRNVELDQVVKKVLDLMMNKSPLLNKLYERMDYGGSFYDGLKIGKPVEFDLYLILKYPFDIRNSKIIYKQSQPGFVKIIDENQKLTLNIADAKLLTKVIDWFDKDNYFLPQKIRQWMISVIQTALNELENNRLMINNKIYQINITTSGPAITLNVKKNNSPLFDVDLTPVFPFKLPLSPPKCFRPISNRGGMNNTWYIVPKPMKIDNKQSQWYWRLSFYEQEKMLMLNRNAFKPVLRLLKKFRDTHHFEQLKSYYLKTIFLWELENTPAEFWNSPLSELFIYMLKKLANCLYKGEIPYYWEKNFNLIKGLNPATLNNFNYYINNMITNIDRNIKTEPLIIVKYILDPNEYKDFLTKYQAVIHENPRSESSGEDREDTSCLIM